MSAPYEKTLQFLYEKLPMFQRIGAAALKKDLANTLRLCEHLGNPQRKFKSIHVAGTNGKGSSCHMLSSILQTAGYRTGLYTSPHLKEFTERIKINGQEIGQKDVVEFVERTRAVIEEIKPSFFEVTVAMAFDYFAKQQVDIAVIEVGLGGRLDSTNVINPLVSLITNIGYDHKDILGNTLSEIASEKAGIIKPKSIAILSERQEEILPIFLQKAARENTEIFIAPETFQVEEIEDGDLIIFAQGQEFIARLKPDLKGKYQKKNLPGVLSVVENLQRLGFAINQSQIIKGIQETVANTGLKGRWQQLGTNPIVFCDVAHNAEGMKEVVETIDSYRYNQLWIIMGMVKDKDISGVLELLPKDAAYVFCESKIPRALAATTLALKAAEVGLNGIVVKDVNDALRHARSKAAPDDLIFVGGSTFVVAELENL